MFHPEEVSPREEDSAEKENSTGEENSTQEQDSTLEEGSVGEEDSVGDEIHWKKSSPRRRRFRGRKELPRRSGFKRKLPRRRKLTGNGGLLMIICTRKKELTNIIKQEKNCY